MFILYVYANGHKDDYLYHQCLYETCLFAVYFL